MGRCIGARAVPRQKCAERLLGVCDLLDARGAQIPRVGAGVGSRVGSSNSQPNTAIPTLSAHSGEAMEMSTSA